MARRSMMMEWKNQVTFEDNELSVSSKYVLTALIYILTEPLIGLPIIATNTNPSKINETNKEKNDDKLTDEREDIIHEMFIEAAVSIKECVTILN